LRQLTEAPDSTRPTTHLRAEPDEAQLLSHRHHMAEDGHEVHSPAKTTNDKCRLAQARSAAMEAIPLASIGERLVRIVAAFQAGFDGKIIA
jgi:hypothetical protein